MNTQKTAGWAILGGFALLLAYLLKNAKSLLHEQVTSSIITPQGTITPDPLTGAPRFDSTIAATIPANFDSAVAPIAPNGVVTPYPNDPTGATCPAGHLLWKDEATGAYWCLLQ